MAKKRKPRRKIVGKAFIVKTPWIAEALRIKNAPESEMITVKASLMTGKTMLADLFDKLRKEGLYE